MKNDYKPHLVVVDVLREKYVDEIQELYFECRNSSGGETNWGKLNLKLKDLKAQAEFEDHFASSEFLRVLYQFFPNLWDSFQLTLPSDFDLSQVYGGKPI